MSDEIKVEIGPAEWLEDPEDGHWTCRVIGRAASGARAGHVKVAPEMYFNEQARRIVEGEVLHALMLSYGNMETSNVAH
jgi:hypothetical protein